MHVYEVLRRPIVTEKSNAQAAASNQYTFEVDSRANKMQVKDAVETAFNVTVLAVRIVTIPPKIGHFGRRRVTKRPESKKAIVSLAPGNSIQFFEGI